MRSIDRQRILAHVAATPACPLENLFEATGNEVSRDAIYSLIATGDIYVDLFAGLLCEPETVTLWLEKPPQHYGANAGTNTALAPTLLLTLRAGHAVDWDGRRLTVLNADESHHAAR